MKCLLYLALILPFLVCAETSGEKNYRYKQKINDVLKKSVFGKNQPPEELVGGQIPVYDPVLLTITSSMYSRLPNRNESRYQQVLLPPLSFPPLSDSEVCPYGMRAFIKRSQTGSSYTFVILPGAYATWKRGSFNNQTIAALDTRFQDPNIIAFDGYLSSAFLRGTCNKIPWNAMAIAKDMYSRLSSYLIHIQANPKFTGIIGYSGGGGLAPLILAEDALSVQKNNQRFFGLGGAVFSPTLHGRTIFNNLDTSVKNIPHNNALLTFDLNLGMFIASAYWNDYELNWMDIVDLYENDPKDFLERSFNQFTEDLKNTLMPVGVTPNMINDDFGYYNAYINTGFRNDMYPTVNCPDEHNFSCSKTPDGTVLPYIDSQRLGLLYDKVTDLRPALDKIDRPFLIYFSQDDPVLSSWDNSGQPQAITEVLEHAKDNPHIIVFNPKYGGHVGQFLDPIFEDLIHVIFSHSE